MNMQSIMDSIKELVKKGNVARIVVRKAEKEVLNVPVTAGVVGAAIGVTMAKWATLAAVLATIGFGCTVEVVKEDGNVVNVMDEERNKKVREFAADTVEKVKENIPVSIKVDVNREIDAEDAETEFADVVAEDEPKEE